MFVQVLFLLGDTNTVLVTDTWYLVALMTLAPSDCCTGARLLISYFWFAFLRLIASAVSAGAGAREDAQGSPKDKEGSRAPQ